MKISRILYMAVFVLLTSYVYVLPGYTQVLPATCEALVTDIDMWSQDANGVDLRAYTNSTLHWIGCNLNGCNPDSFFCDYDPTTQTLSFGTTTTGPLRAALDPGNAEGDLMPTEGGGGCCTSDAPLFNPCDAPDSNNNGAPIDSVDALCKALGYQSGSLTEVTDDTSCPDVDAVAPNGSDWNSDFVIDIGYSTSITCVGFRDTNVNVPTLSEWGLIAMAGILGIVGFMVLKRRKVTA
ncbi:MAG: IPTL-CTERM sorting domain-containing protein [Thermodesulfobacteriota bacterium]